MIEFIFFLGNLKQCKVFSYGKVIVMTATENAKADVEGQNGRTIEMQQANPQAVLPNTEENTEAGVKEGGYGW